MDEIERLVHRFSDATVHFVTGPEGDKSLWTRYCRSRDALLAAIRAAVSRPTVPERPKKPCKIHEYDGAFRCTTHDRIWGAVTDPDEPCPTVPDPETIEAWADWYDERRIGPAVLGTHHGLEPFRLNVLLRSVARAHRAATQGDDQP